MLSPEMGLLLQPLLRRGLALVVARAVAGDLRAAAFFTGAASSFAAAVTVHREDRQNDHRASIFK